MTSPTTQQQQQHQQQQQQQQKQSSSADLSSLAMSLSDFQQKILSYPPIDRTRQILSYPTVSSFVAGGVAGAVSRTVVSPFERMKIIFQLQHSTASSQYQGVIPTLKKMWNDEGWRGFMRGNGTNCIRIIPYSAVQFSTYTVLKAYIVTTVPENPPNYWSHLTHSGQTGTTNEKDSLLIGSSSDPAATSSLNSKQTKIATSVDNVKGRPLTTPERLTAGCLAGIASVAVTYPLDIIRTRLSIQTAAIGNLREHYAKLGQKPPGIMQVGKQIYRTEGGLRGLYRGMIPTTMGVAPYVGLNFAVYEWMREWLVNLENSPAFQTFSVGSFLGLSSAAASNGQCENNLKLVSEPGALGKLFAGATSGAVAQTLTYPFDVLRRRFQVVSMDKSAGMGFRYTSVWNALSTIVKTEGWFGLYKGLSANLLKVVPSMAASWLSFEYVKDILAY